MWEYQNTKQPLRRATHSKLAWDVFVIKKAQKNVPLTYYITADLNSEEIVRTFFKKELQKTSQKEFRVEKLKV